MTDTAARTASASPGPDVRRAAVLASVAALLLGSGITVLVHEIGHWVAGAALGHPSRLTQFAVSHAGDPSATDVALMALAGPAVSLVVGLGMTMWTPLRRSGGTAHLLWLWIGFTSLQEFVTYLVITPFGAGDTAMVVAALDWPVPVMFVALALGLAGMFWQARRFAGHVQRHSGGDLGLARCLAWFPWVVGVVLMLLVQIVMVLIAAVDVTTGETVVILLATMSITVFAPMAFIFLGRTEAEPAPLDLPRFPTGLVIGYLVLLVINVVLSLLGPTLG